MNKKQFDKYKQSNDRWAVCDNVKCDTDYQPRKEKDYKCPVCSGNIGYWVDERHPDIDWDEYLATDEELERKELQESKKNFIGSAHIPCGLDNAKSALLHEVEQIIRDYKGDNKQISIDFCIDDTREVEGVVVSCNRGLSENDIHTYFIDQIDKSRRNNKDQQVLDMSDDEYQKYIEDRMMEEDHSL